MALRSRSILSAAALAVIAGWSSLSLGADNSARGPAPAAPAPSMTNTAGASDATTDTTDTTEHRPLMDLLRDAGIYKPFDVAGFKIYGHIEGSYTYNFDSPPTSLSQYKVPVGKFIDNPGRVFDIENEKLLLNQLTLNIERSVSLASVVQKGQVDVGGRVELLYGSDARFIHSNGLLDNHDNDQTVRITGGPLNQFDIPNAYIDVAIPVGNGLRIRAGKFTYFKQIDPDYSPFYSHSFTFGGALPFTLTGVYGTYVINKQLTVEGGFSRGWDQSIDDNNDAIDGFGRLTYLVGDNLRLGVAAISGPEQDNDNSHWRTAIDFTATYEPTDKLTLLADLVYGQQEHPSGDGGTARWYGVSVYAVQEITKEISAGVRLEWYRDEGGYTTGLTQNLYEATAGVTVRPFAGHKYLQQLKIRPEIRVDYSSERYFDGFDRHSQVTAAIDAIFDF